MALYKQVDFSGQVRSVGNGGKQIVIKETITEVDLVQGSRAGGKGRGQHGKGSGNHVEVRQTKIEDDFNTRTGEFTERQEENIVDL